MARRFTDEFEPMGIILEVPVKRRRGKHRSVPHGLDFGKDGRRGAASGQSNDSMRRRVGRVVRRVPETVVKITSKSQGRKQIREHLSYITRNGELAAQADDGGVVIGRRAVQAVADSWWDNRAVKPGSRRSNSTETVNFMLSMPAGTDRERFAAAAKIFADRAFGGKHEYLLAEHRDTDHVHVHVSVRTLGHDGVRLNPRKADLQMWREWLAHQLRAKGIEAEATPRRARGVVKKGQAQSVWHLNLRGASMVQRAKIKEAVMDMSRRTAFGERPWEDATKAKQQQIRGAWMRLAKQYEKEDGRGSRMAADIREFVAMMPPVLTEREEIRRTVATTMRDRAHDQSRER